MIVHALHKSPNINAVEPVAATVHLLLTDSYGDLDHVIF